MKITRRPDIEQFILDEICQYFVKLNEERTGIHISDLLCLRQAYFQRVKPLPPTNKQVQYFLIGRGHEESLHATSGSAHGEEQEWEGIIFTPDFYHNFPDESKTRRGYLAKPGEETEKYDHYINQLRAYCAVTDKTMGWLRVWSLMEKQDDFTTAPEFAAYELEFTPGELAVERDSLRERREILLEGLRQQNHKLLPQCPEWMCGKVHRNTVVKAFCLDCKKEFTFPERHKKSKPHHSIAPAEYTYDYVKNCKWFDDCQPHLRFMPKQGVIENVE